jgi:hypothetical protein
VSRGSEVSGGKSGGRRVRLRLWCGTAATVLCAALLVLTLAVPQWIEVLFGADPDAGSGETEWGIVLALAAVTAISAGFTVRTWRRLAADSA